VGAAEGHFTTVGTSSVRSANVEIRVTRHTTAGEEFKIRALKHVRD
jgi:hypothetical protein